MIYGKMLLEVPKAIYHLENYSKHQNYFRKLEQGQLGYYTHRTSYYN